METISRQAAIDALWKALFKYEDETEKQFIESEELDVGDWFSHRIFVQNMNGLDIKTLLNLPPAQPEPWVTEIEEEYKKAVSTKWIRKPLAKALYEVWKKHDREDVERRTDESD